tara:strand:+ start:283 stop:1728 length:1446 start_codon:yes stop_codon:yes gene_type:complete
MISYNFIASINENFIIGIHNTLLIECREDLKQFYKITTDSYPEGDQNILIMGYKTWLSIPDNVKPFRKRFTIVLSREHTIEETDELKCFHSLESSFEWIQENKKGRVFVIGGEGIYQECISKYPTNLNCVYLTRFKHHYLCKGVEARRLPYQTLTNQELMYESVSKESPCIINAPNMNEEKTMEHSLFIYQNKNQVNRGEYQYLTLLKNILENGDLIEGRNGNVLSTFGERMVFDLEKGFPLLTTKKMGYKTILRELLWFIKGSTNNKELNDKNVHIWDQNASQEFLESRGLTYEEGDLGPVYGFQWRHFGAKYKDCNTDYTNQGVDQVQYVIDTIRNDPSSRRIVMSAWNPSDLHKMALPPCHVMCQFYVNKDKIDCQLYQRSGDMFLGVPFNIVSYSFLLCIICKITGYTPGRFIHILGDAHIYENHIQKVEEQLKRIPTQFPTLEISDELKNINDIQEDYFILNKYRSYSKINAPMSA